jgi:hypothetical protein
MGDPREIIARFRGQRGQDVLIRQRRHPGIRFDTRIGVLRIFERRSYLSPDPLRLAFDP